MVQNYSSLNADEAMVIAEQDRDFGYTHMCVLDSPYVSRSAITAKCPTALSGFPGSPAINIDDVAKVMEALGAFLRGVSAIPGLDLNLVVVCADSDGCVALDAPETVSNTNLIGLSASKTCRFD